MGWITYKGGRRENRLKKGEFYESEDGSWVVVDKYWLPGVYATLEAASLAVKQDDALLQRLTKEVCWPEGENRTITVEDLRAAAGEEG